MTPELKELYRQTIAQKDREIAELKVRILHLEKELQQTREGNNPRPEQVIVSPICPTVTA